MKPVARQPVDPDILPVPPDNYAYGLVAGAEAAVIDPGQAAPVLRWLERRGLRLAAILNTHAHPDHTAGNLELKRAFGCPVWAPEDEGIPGVDRRLGEGDTWTWGGHRLAVLATPGHTRACLSLHEPGAGWLFCADTLFLGGCGRPLECPPSVLWESLLRLAALPPETRVYCGHEYTGANLRFALSLLPLDPFFQDALATALARRARGEPTVPGTLGRERRANIFLRAAEPAVQQAVGLPGAPPAEVFAELRRRKDAWRG